MNTDNVPIKYQMSIWKGLKGYPTKNDVLYEIYSYLFKNSKTEFSEQTLNSLWFDEKGVGNWRGTTYEKHFIDLLKDLIIRESKTVNDKSWFIIDEKKNIFL